MLPRVVIDSTVLVSALLRPDTRGPSFAPIEAERKQAFELYTSSDIIAETERTLLTRQRIRKRYRYSDEAVALYLSGLSAIATSIRDIPSIKIVRDPNDDMILACALAADAQYLVTRDDDLLSLEFLRESPL